MFMVVVVVIVMMVVVLIFRQSKGCVKKLLGKIMFSFHDREDLLASQLIPGSSYDGRFIIDGPKKLKGLLKAFFLYVLGAAQENGIGKFNLIVVEFTEIFQIHFCPLGIGNRNITVENDIFIIGNTFNSLNHVG